MTGPLTPARIESLCERAGVELAAGRVDPIVIDLAMAEPDATAVEAMARLLLTARRLGGRVRYRHAGREISELVALMGLEGVLRVASGESQGEPEQGEQLRGVEEERDP